MDRRDFLAHAGGCAAHLALAGALLPASARAAWARAPLGRVVAREPFGALEQVADGVWALVSTPLGGDRTTLCNGGLIAGRAGVLAVEGFMQPAGAHWLATKARELTGRWPTHAVVTHFHADHASGIAGYLPPMPNGGPAGAPHETPNGAPTIHATAATRDRVAALRDAVLIPADAPSTIDLGGRVVRLVPRAGHTPSDVTLELDDPAVTFTGDLVWNAMFPNFVDALPSPLAASVRALRRAPTTTYVPGHGPVARAADLDRYVAMLDEIERAAKSAHAAGRTAAEGAAGFTLPASLGAWALFNPAFYQRAFDAWYREIE